MQHPIVVTQRSVRRERFHVPPDRNPHRDMSLYPPANYITTRRASDGMPNLHAFRAHLERVAASGSNSGSQKSSLKQLHKEYHQLQKQCSPVDPKLQELQQAQHQLHKEKMLNQVKPDDEEEAARRRREEEEDDEVFKQYHSLQRRGRAPPVTVCDDDDECLPVFTCRSPTPYPNHPPSHGQA